MSMDTISRRALLKTAGCIAAGNSGIVRAANAIVGMSEDIGVTPFRFHADQSALDDLRMRLEHVRVPERETCNDWSEGVALAKLRALIEYWRTRYDWRRCESELNSFPQYRITIDGLDIHFLHVRSPHPDALPLIITHGWPGSVIEFLGIIGPLTNPTAHGGRAEDAFHVVAPSLPGFGFSGKPRERGWNVDRIAAAWSELMRRLGYTQYVAQGGDWGAWVTTRLAQQRPEGLKGVHLNLPLVIPDPIPEKGMSPGEQRAADSLRRFRTKDFGYFEEQATRPQTIGYALMDSPAGLAAWIYEQFYFHTDNRGDPEEALSLDQMLDDITLYWLTGTAASAARIFFENADLGGNAGTVEMPVGCSIFPHEIYQAPRNWAEACYPRLIYWHELDRGGHFAAFEQPALFTNELRACFHLLGNAPVQTMAAALAATRTEPMSKQEIIRSYYAGWERKDWGAVERLLIADFTFTSPNGDDHINRAAFHSKCWPEAEWIGHFDLEDVAVGDHEAFVKYLCRTTRGTSFRNVEYFRFTGEKIAAIECYFGGAAGYPSKSASTP